MWEELQIRWTNYLRPDVKRGKFSLQEEQTIIQLHALLGNRWSIIATQLPKITNNEIKSYWNTHLKKRLKKMQIDPVTHKPKSHALGPDQLKDAANLSHMAQWEGVRLEAEARLRESKLQVSNPFQETQLGSSSSAQHVQPPCLDVLTAWRGSWLKAPKYNNEFSATSVTLDSLTSTFDFPKKGEAMGLSSNFQDEMEILQLQSLAYPTDDDSLATGNDENMLLPNSMEAGFADILLDNSNQLYPSITGGNSGNVAGSFCGADFEVEENKYYWESGTTF